MNYSRGNILFIILIAISLFAALSYAITQTNSSGGKGIQGESLSLRVDELLSFAEQVKAGVDYIYSHNGISEEDIRFAHPDLAAGYGDPGALSSAQMVFHPSGGGVTYSAPETALLDGTNTGNAAYGTYYFTGSTNVTDVGTTASDLIMILPLISQEACTEINRKLGIAVIPQDAAVVNTTQYVARQFAGSFSASETFGDGTTLSNYDVIHGKTTLCIESTGAHPVANTYHFYKVLLER